MDRAYLTFASMWFLEKVFLMIAEILSLWLHRPLIALLKTFRLDLSSKFPWSFRYNLKTGSNKMIYWHGRYSFIVGFIISKNPKGLWFCPNVSTTPITAMGYRQCLPLSVVQLKGKHCRHPIAIMEVANAFQLCVLQMVTGGALIFDAPPVSPGLPIRT